MKFETKAVHGGGGIDPETGAVAPPIHLSTTFERTPEGESSRGFGYVRESNPTQVRLEAALAAIDGAEAALVFASGMAAAASLLQALPTGAHVIFPDDCYHGVQELAHRWLPRWDISHTVVAVDEIEEVERAIASAPTDRAALVVWVETPSNPLLKIADLTRLGELCRAAGALLVVDGTFATPALQRPIELGADVVLHSTTKYLGGHSDVQGGALAFRSRGRWFDATLEVRSVLGAVSSPFNSWLILRGIRSLAARMRAHSENALAVAQYLARHERVEKVFYPGLSDHRGFDAARRQMSAPGGMLSFLLRGSREEALALTGRVKLFVRATSLGGVESLIEHRHSSEGEGSRTPVNLLRLSVGLEHADDLIADLEQALGG